MGELHRIRILLFILQNPVSPVKKLPATRDFPGFHPNALHLYDAVKFRTIL
jgi:hypothetical protein